MWKGPTLSAGPFQYMWSNGSAHLCHGRRGEQLVFIEHHFSGEALLSFLGLIAAMHEPALHHKAGTLADLGGQALCLLTPDHHGVPLGIAPPFSISAFVALVGGQVETKHMLAIAHLLQLRVSAQIADQLHFVLHCRVHGGWFVVVRD